MSNHWVCLVIQQAFSKPCLVNLISKDTHLVTDQLLLETILMMIRQETIKYSSYKKKNNEKNEKQLENDIKILEQNVMNNLSEVSADDIKTLEEVKCANRTEKSKNRGDNFKITLQIRRPR